MTDSAPDSQNSFVLQKQAPSSSQEPLEVHHLSHDLRGPLNSILGFSELLLEGIEGPLTEMQMEDIAAINESAKNLLRLINNVVDLSKLQAKQLNCEFSPVNLDTILQRVAGFDFGANKPAQLEVVVDQAVEMLPPLWGDATRIEQMILNLIRYAFRRKRSGQLNLIAQAAGPAVIIRVGFDEVLLSSVELNQLFELGVKVDPGGRSELGPGGLELPLARGLAETHHGQAWAESTAEAGTYLYLKLPVYADRISEFMDKQ